jgi:hypothetical protein
VPRANHTCPAPRCRLRCPPSKLACKEHWFKLPRPIRVSIMTHYVEGQTLATASSLYLDALQAAIDFWGGGGQCLTSR